MTISWLNGLIGLLGFCLTALGTYLTFTATLPADKILVPLIFIIIGLLLFSITGWYTTFYKNVYLKRVISGRMSIHKSLNELLKDENKIKSIHRKNIGQSVLTDSCQYLSLSLNKYHRKQVAVSMQYINVIKDTAQGDIYKFYVHILCRNIDSRFRKRTLPHKQEHLALDFVEENTDFNYLFAISDKLPDHKLYYLNNYLPYSRYYKNSHFSQRFVERTKDRFGFIKRVIYWDLPYKSTIVVPIMYTIESNSRISSNSFNTNEVNKSRSIVGFLSIDSPSLGAFSKKYDLPIVMEFANTIRPWVIKYAEANLLK